MNSIGKDKIVNIYKTITKIHKEEVGHFVHHFENTDFAQNELRILSCQLRYDYRILQTLEMIEFKR